MLLGFTAFKLLVKSTPAIQGQTAFALLYLPWLYYNYIKNDWLFCSKKKVPLQNAMGRY